MADRSADKGHPFGRWTLRAVADLAPDPRNPRKHSRAQIRAIARSIESFGFNAPVLVDKTGRILAGHGRYQAALLLGLSQIPVISLEHLSEAQARGYLVADNKLVDGSAWDGKKLAQHLKELSDLALDFDIEATGFATPEIDLRIQSLDVTPVDAADDFEFASGPVVSRPGDLWILGSHRLSCASALDLAAYDTVLAGEKAAAVFADPCYAVKINVEASGEGNIAEGELALAGAMGGAEFTRIVRQVTGNLSAKCRDGALLYLCIDWEHMGEWLAATRGAGLHPLELCVWAKASGGMGPLYRSRHELIFLFEKGQDLDLDKVESGRRGRNRSNVWDYPGAGPFSRRKGSRRRGPYPPAKPIALIADAILDCTKPNDIVLDPFVCSGTTILAAERTGRRCYGIEPSPRYVDTAIRRWQRLTGREALDGQGRTFDEVAIERGGAQ
jgi:DNA modification methylase